MEIKDEFDLEFSLLIREIENYTFANSYDKSVRIRIKNWIKKISQTSNNLEWKKKSKFTRNKFIKYVNQWKNRRAL